MYAGIDYPAAVFVGILVWQFFQRILFGGTYCLRQNSNAISRAYFKRILFPVATSIDALIDFIIGFPGIFFIIYSYNLNIAIPSVIAGGLLILPLMLVAGFILAAFMTILDFLFYDIRFCLPFATQTLIFFTPVLYSVQDLPFFWQPVVALNPMTGAFELVRWALCGSRFFPSSTSSISLGILAMLGVLVCFIFLKMDSRIGDRFSG